MKNLFFLIVLCVSSKTLLPQMAISSEQWDNDRMQQTNTSNVNIQNSYEVVDIDVNAIIKEQIAEVTVTQTLLNPNNTSLEVEIFFPLPNGGIVQNFMLMVNGKELPGKLLNATEAKGIYEGIVRRKRDPALMEYAGYGLYKTSIFPIPVGEQRKITIRYTQVLDKLNDVISFSYPFGTQKFSGKALKSVSLTAKITSNDEIKNAFSPTDEVKTDRRSKNEIIIKYDKTYYLPSQDFKFNYSVSNANMGTSLVSYWPGNEKNGYFMLMSSPGFEEKDGKVVNKNIVLVLDRSGSMAGKKIEQAKKAMEFVVKNLNEGDMFNLIMYDDRTESYKNEMQVFNNENMKTALSWISDIQSTGGTNIYDAVTIGLKFLESDQRPNYLLFLTDGLPTAGTIGENEIASAAEKNNKHNTRIFAFGVGDDVNARLLDRLTTASNGLSVHVKPSEDIESPVANLYSSISSPVFTNIKVKIDGTDISQTYPEKMPDVFKGGQMVWVGKYTKSGKVKVTIEGNYKGTQKTFSYDQTLFAENDGNTFDYVEKIWASRRVGHLINLIDLNGRNQELIDDLVAVSKKYGILTPYTSFIALEETELDGIKLSKETEDNLKALDNVSGSTATNVRSEKMKDMNEVMVTSDVVSKDYDGNEKKVETIKKVANKTFYYKNQTWLDESLTNSNDSTKVNENVVTIKRYSKEYFELAQKNNNEVNQYLSLNGNVRFNVNNVTYEVIEEKK